MTMKRKERRGEVDESENGVTMSIFDLELWKRQSFDAAD